MSRKPKEHTEHVPAGVPRRRRLLLGAATLLFALTLLGPPPAALAADKEDSGPTVEISLPTVLMPALLRLWQTGPVSVSGLQEIPAAALADAPPLEPRPADGRVAISLPDREIQARLPEKLSGRELEARAAEWERGTLVAVFPRGEAEQFLGGLGGTRVRDIEIARAEGALVLFPVYKNDQLHELDLAALSVKDWKYFGGDWLAATDGQLAAVRQATVTYELQKWLPEGLLISLITIFWISLLAIFLTRRLTKVPTRTQAALELIVTGLQDFIVSIVGPHGKKYLPLAGTAFLYILMMNLSGLIPGWTSPTSNINVTAALALCVFVYVQYEGIRANGLFGYLKHFAGEPIWLAPINVPIHIIGELARPLSLAIRLFVNIFGEKTVVVVLISLSGMFFGSLPIPGHFPILFLAIFVSFIQALVFTVLTCVYLASATSHGDEHEHHDEAPGHGAEHAPATA